MKLVFPVIDPEMENEEQPSSENDSQSAEQVHQGLRRLIWLIKSLLRKVL